MMVHPGLDDPNQKDPSAYSGRSQELAVLTDSAVREALLANHIQQIDFSFLLGAQSESSHTARWSPSQLFGCWAARWKTYILFSWHPQRQQRMANVGR
jgi:hypothetical protein